MDRLFDPAEPEAFAARWLEAKGLTDAAESLRIGGQNPTTIRHLMEA